MKKFSQLLIACMLASTIFAEQPLTARTPETTPSLADCAKNIDFSFSGDFLWWRSDEENLIYAEIQRVSSLNFFLGGSSERFDNDWDPGFRISMTGNLPHDHWDLFVNWTWYRNHTSNSITAEAGPTNIGIHAVWLADTAEEVTSATAKRRLLLNLGRVELGRTTLVGKMLSLRPAFGIEGGWMNRDFRVQYGPTAPTLFQPDSPGRYHGKSNYWGIGPEICLNAHWNIYSGLNLDANLLTALLYGEVYRSQAICFQNEGGGPEIQTLDVNNKDFWKLMPHLQIFIGLGWENCIYNDKMFFSLNLGWETNLFWNVPHFVIPGSILSVIQDSSTNVSTVGLTLNAKLGF